MNVLLGMYIVGSKLSRFSLKLRCLQNYCPTKLTLYGINNQQSIEYEYPLSMVNSVLIDPLKPLNITNITCRVCLYETTLIAHCAAWPRYITST